MTTLRTITLATLLLVALTTLAHADVTKEPGYFDLEWIQIPDGADEIQDIDLSAVLTEVAANAREEGDDELAEVLAMVRSVRVKAFSVRANDLQTQEAVDRANQMLREGGWNRLIFVKDGDESVTVSSMHQDGLMVGLAAVMYEPGDGAAFINVVGDLDLATMLGLAGEFDLDDLDDIMDDYGHGADDADTEARAERERQVH
jgi:hypothetical protein